MKTISQKRFMGSGHSYEELRKDTLIWRHGTKGKYIRLQIGSRFLLLAPFYFYSFPYILNGISISVGFAVILAPFAALTLMTLSHEHAEVGLPYQKIRNKPFPWKECPTCDLLDFDCWSKCRADKK